MKKPTLSALRKPSDLTSNRAVSESKRTSSEPKKMSLYVTMDTWRSLQLRKLDEGRDVNAIVNDAIQSYLKSGSGV